MTQYPTQPQWQPQQQPPAQPPESKPFYRKVWFWALVGALTFFAGCTAVTLAGIGAGIDEAVSPAQNSIATDPAAAPSTVDVAPASDWYTPKVTDFKLQVVETGREHFGSAGDNVEYELELVKTTSHNYDPDKEYKLKYQVTGAEDGPSTDTIVVRGDSYEQPYEGIASTRRNVKLSAKVLSIREA